MSAEPRGSPPQRPAGPLERSLGALHRVEDALLALLLSGMIGLSAAQILLRNVFDVGFTWAEPLLRVSVLWVGLLGALAASRGDRQISIDVLARLLPPRAQGGVRALTALFTAGVSGVIAFHAGRFVSMEYQDGTAGIGAIPAWALELVLPWAFGLIAVRYAIVCWLRVAAAWRGDPPPEGPTFSGAATPERGTEP